METVEYLSRTVWATLKPSEFGIGVFAIRDIPMGQRVTDYSVHNLSPRILTLAPKEMETLPVEIRTLILDRTAFKANEPLQFYSPNCEQTLRSFMNHSDTPNTDGEYTLRSIDTGEELTEDYRTLADSMHPLSLAHYSWLQNSTS
jgi:hypothetical protein